MTVDAAIIAIIVAISVWDVWLYLRPPSGDTISERLRVWGRSAPGVPFAWAALFGHFWGPALPMIPRWSPAVLALLWGLLLVLGWRLRPKLSWWQLGLVGISGVLAGAVLWSQA